MPETFSIYADGVFRPIELEMAQEIVRRLNRMGIVRRNPETGEVIERSGSAATAARLAAALESGEFRFAPDEEDKASISWVLREWLDAVGASEFPDSAMTLRYALLVESQPPMGG